MITLDQYFGSKHHLPEHAENARDLLERVNKMIAHAISDGAFAWAIDPDTGTEISGERHGAGDGGFRLPSSATGRAGSSHKEGRGVDVYDPGNRLDAWLTSFDVVRDEVGADLVRETNTALEKYGLYREHPKATPGWTHLTTRRPGSGRRTFYP